MIFISKKYKSLRVVLDPKSYQIIEGKRLVVGLEGKFKIGKTIEFENHKFETDDKAVIDALKNSDQYGFEYYALEKDKEGKVKEVKLSEQALRKINEKKELVEDVADTD